ncbi:hypothetical protein Tco_0380984 [Tanacetum coccineum]
MAIDKRRSKLMVELIDKQMRERWIIRNLERLVGARELEMDYKLMTRTEDSNLPIHSYRAVCFETFLFENKLNQSYGGEASVPMSQSQSACSYSIDICKDIMKSQVHVSKDFRYSDTARLP